MKTAHIRLGLTVHLLIALTCLGNVANAQFPEKISIPRPGDREFVADLANMISEEDEKKIRELADKLLTDKAAPIIVVTIPSMADYDGAGLRIETFARLLFDQWGIGPEKFKGQQWNYGILFLISQNDRKARIELGAGWKREKDSQAEQIMNDLIIPKFKQGEFSAGIVAGVEGLDKMARDLKLPTRPITQTEIIIGLVVLGLIIFTVVSLIRKGVNGWAWVFWGVVFAVIGTLLYTMLTSRSGSSGSYGGGSFGGGFSGGGGATGSW